MGVVILDANKSYVSTVKAFDKYSDIASSGRLTVIEFLVPQNAKYLCSSMFTQKAITDDVYYGDLDDFACVMVKLSNDEYINQLRQRGKENLSEYSHTVSFEGEAETSQMFEYGTDFFIGDVVQVANEYGHEARARVIEIVTSESEDGRTVYPTFSTITDMNIEE